MKVDLLTVEEATQAVLERACALPPIRLPLSMARECLLAEDVSADGDSPPFDKALMDGFALRFADLRNGVGTLRIVEELYAGSLPSRSLMGGDASLIMTGAPIPEGADTVVMIERTRRDGDRVLVEDPSVRPGGNILRRGREMRAGDVIVRRGETLTPTRLGMLASAGRPSPLVVPAPRVAIVPTGDELVESNQVPGPGQIRNSNAVVLEALVAGAGAIPLLSPIARDDPEILREALGEGLASDVLLITGGVSAGQRDLVPATLMGLGVERVFHKVRLKPGKPLFFGVGPRRGEKPGTLVFGLPGNPVSGVVGFLLFVRPALDLLAGRAGRPLGLPLYPLTRAFVHAGEKPTYHPARRVEWTGRGPGTVGLEPLASAGSADLLTASRADGFALFPAGDRAYAPGDVVGFLDLG
ncbi:MAG: molybdopterin molybdotransferase MoeA [Isosphaeraceae bacterium]|nr:molybdopterin molybdotransferase MoeA [Isosphaeraceae bacterium]